MKALYPKHRSAHSRHANATRKTIFLSLLFIALAVYSFAAGTPALNFKTYTLVSGKAGADGAVYRFSQVDPKTDALIKIKGRSDALVYLVNIDLSTTGFDKALQPVVGYNKNSTAAAREWWMEFEISFVQTNTNVPVTVNDFNLTALDIDGNGSTINEYVSFYGLSSYKLELNSVLTLSNITQLLYGLTSVVGKRFDGPTKNFANIDTSATSVMVTSAYRNTNLFTMRAGGVNSGRSANAERMNSFYFKDFSYQSPQLVTLDAKLKSFNATLSSSKAILNWVSFEKDMSHYVVERSRNGHDFTDVTMIFANDKGSDEIAYSFTDNLNGAASGLVYYRLKMINAKGRAEYSAIRIIRLNSNREDATVTAYPNPVLNELRITIPASWQNKAVKYEMYNMNGQMVKHFQSNSASQTETMVVNDMKPGVYTIRLSNGNDVAAQRIVKADQ